MSPERHIYRGMALQVNHQITFINHSIRITRTLEILQSARLDHDRQRNEEPGTLGVSRRICPIDLHLVQMENISVFVAQLCVRLPLEC